MATFYSGAAFNPCDPSRCKSDAVNTSFLDSRANCCWTPALDDIRSRNILQSAYPKLALTNDWRKDLQTYKQMNLRIPNKLTDVLASTPPHFMQDITKCIDPNLNPHEVSTTRDNGNDTSRQKLKRKISETQVAVRAESDKQNQATLPPFTIELCTLSSADVSKALSVLQSPEMGELLFENAKGPVKRRARWRKQGNKNERINTIVKRGLDSLAVSPGNNTSNSEESKEKDQPQILRKRGRPKKSVFEGFNLTTISAIHKHYSKGETSQIPKTVTQFTETQEVTTVMPKEEPSRGRVQSKTSPTTNPTRRSPRSPKSPRKFSEDGWIYPTNDIRRIKRLSMDKCSTTTLEDTKSSLAIDSNIQTVPLRSSVHLIKLGKRLPSQSTGTACRGEHVRRDLTLTSECSLSTWDANSEHKSNGTTRLSPKSKSLHRSSSSFQGIKIASLLRRSPKSKSAVDEEMEKQKNKCRKRRSILDELANTDGYVADKRQKKSEDLLVDAAQLGREEKALQRAIMKFTEMECKIIHQVEKSPVKKNRFPKSSLLQKATKLKNSALNGPKVFRSASSLKAKYDDFKPQVLGARTRLQAAGSEGIQKFRQYHKDSAYEHALSSDEQRRREALRAKQHLFDEALQPQLLQQQTQLLQQQHPPHASEEPTIQKRRPYKPRQKSSVHQRRPRKGLRSLWSRCFFGTKKRRTKRRGQYETIFRDADNLPPFSEHPGLDGVISAVEPLPIASVSLTKIQTIPGPCVVKTEVDADSLSMSSQGDSSRMHVPAEVKRLAVCRETGETILHKAVRMGYYDIVAWCCKTRYVDVNARDYAGFSALHETCVSQRVDIAQCLLKHGADVNVASRLDGVRPLHDAIERNNFALVRLFLAWGADPTLSTYSGRIAMNIARTLDMKDFLRAYFVDLNGANELDSEHPWPMSSDLFQCSGSEGCGSSSVEQQKIHPHCSEIMVDLPEEDEDQEEKMLFEFSDQPLPPTFKITLRKSESPQNYLLLDDFLSRMDLRRQEVESSHPQLDIRDVPLSAVEGPQAYDLCLVVKPMSPLVSLVKYDNCVRSLLGVTTELIDVSCTKADFNRTLTSSQCSTQSAVVETEDMDTDIPKLPDVTDEELSQLEDTDTADTTFSDRCELDDMDDYYRDCKGCSSPEIGFSDYEDDAQPLDLSNMSDSLSTNQPQPSESPASAADKRIMISLVSGKTILQQSVSNILNTSPSPPKRKSRKKKEKRSEEKNEGAAFHYINNNQPFELHNPVFVMAPDGTTKAIPVLGDSLLLDNSFTTGHPRSLLNSAMLSAATNEPIVVESDEEMNSPQKDTTVASSISESPENNDYGLCIAQVCSLSASDAQQVFGTEVELP